MKCKPFLTLVKFDKSMQGLAVWKKRSSLPLGFNSFHGLNLGPYSHSSGKLTIINRREAGVQAIQERQNPHHPRIFQDPMEASSENTLWERWDKF